MGERKAGPLLPLRQREREKEREREREKEREREREKERERERERDSGREEDKVLYLRGDERCEEYKSVHRKETSISG